LPFDGGANSVFGRNANTGFGRQWKRKCYERARMRANISWFYRALECRQITLCRDRLSSDWRPIGVRLSSDCLGETNESVCAAGLGERRRQLRNKSRQKEGSVRFASLAETAVLRRAVCSGRLGAPLAFKFNQSRPVVAISMAPHQHRACQLTVVGRFGHLYACVRASPFGWPAGAQKRTAHKNGSASNGNRAADMTLLIIGAPA
jgi:hypothetical protein